MEKEPISPQSNKGEKLNLSEKIDFYKEFAENCNLESDSDINKIPILNKEEEVQIAQRIEAGETELREFLVIANIRLARKNAARMYKATKNYHDLEKNDLMQEGMIGLMKAVELFDYKKGSQLSTYANWWINQNLIRAINNQGRPVRLPVHIHEKITRIRKEIHSVDAEANGKPSLSELAGKLKLEEHEVIYLLTKLDESFISLDKPALSQSYEYTLGDFISDPQATNPEEEALRKLFYRHINKLVEKFPPKEKQILEKRFGLNNQEPQSLQKIGDALNLTRERIRQIENNIARKFKIILLQEDTETTTNILKEFSKDEQKILRYSFGLESVQAIPKTKIQKMLNVKREDIKKIEDKCLEKITAHYATQYLDDSH